MKTFLFLITLIISGYSCSTDDTSNITNTEKEIAKDSVITNIAYGDHSLQTYDLFLPEERFKTPAKVVVLVHGGGWTTGDKADMAPIQQLIQGKNNNFAIANINYVLADSMTKAFPNQVNDLVKAVTHLTDNATAYKITPEFAFVGVSAGAHLSMLYSYSFDTDSKVKAVCSVVGPADFTDPNYLNEPLYVNAFPFLVADFNPENVALLQQISPSFQVTKNSPPTLLFYGNQDSLIPNSQHESLKLALDTKGVINELTVYNGGHGNWDASSFLDLDAKLNAFLTEFLK
ncbi:alpha/beta hydrolase [Aquimarina sp. ERC-38]|uniref:alpha/beta hydrolase n=1 Tax=Aquimarina sp. ERC-38 TaxID=2949996 RepID=UPI002245EE99|nr:alpha/beta hydrolase [Aquimarina sp. ERC-38]UZO79794.1 alpha/beta hydrolase [Aquimarina sp. ERC-38]